MIRTLSVTLVIESLIALGYARWRQKPVRSILVTCIGANVITQLLLWGVLTLLFEHYLATLLAAEIGIWWLEGLALYSVPGNRLDFLEALSLSLAMNLPSFALGWFLPL